MRSIYHHYHRLARGNPDWALDYYGRRHPWVLATRLVDEGAPIIVAAAVAWAVVPPPDPLMISAARARRAEAY